MNRAWPANDRGGKKVVDRRFFPGMYLRHEVRHWRLQEASVTVQDSEHTLMGAAGQELGFLIGRGGDYRHANHHIGFGECRRRFELAAVKINGLEEQAGRKVRCEGIRQTSLCGQLCRKQAGPQQPDRHLGSRTRHRNYLLVGLCGRKQLLEISDIPREVGFGFHAITSQCPHGCPVRSRSPPQAQIDSVGVQFGERAKGLGNHQRRVIWQHDTTGADADAGCPAGNIAHQYRGGRTRYSLNIVVFSQPVSGKAERLGVPGCSQGYGKRIRHRTAFADGNEVKHGQGHVVKGFHAGSVRECRPSALFSDAETVFPWQ